jgi:hypothetical protein
VLVDGYVRATWRTELLGDAETLTVRPLGRLSRLNRSDIEREALGLLAFASPGLEHLVEFDAAH